MVHKICFGNKTNLAALFLMQKSNIVLTEACVIFWIDIALIKKGSRYSGGRAKMAA